MQFCPQISKLFPRTLWESKVRAFGIILAIAAAPSEAAETPQWSTYHRHRVLLEVDMKGRERSNSPAQVELDLQSSLGKGRALDEDSIMVIGFDAAGKPGRV